MTPKVIVLPGADSQVPMVKKLRSLGYHVTVFNPYDQSPAFQYSDDCRKVNILDRERCLEYAKDIQPIGIISDMCDIAMPTVAYLAENLGLYSLGSRCASLFTDKWKMRQFCDEYGLPTPKYKMCRNIDEAKGFYRQQNTCCIIKPLDANSSRGVFTIESENDIDAHFNDALIFSKCNRAVLIEQYVNGTEFTVDGIMTPNGHKCLAISEKKHYAYNQNIAYELYFSHTNPSFDYNKLRATNDKYVNLTKLPVGCFTHAEYKYENEQFYLIEIGARGGGNYISSDIVPCMTGIDNYQILIDAMINRQFADVNMDGALIGRCCVLYFFDVEHEGVVKAIDGEQLLQEDQHVLRYHFNFNIGDTVKKADNDSARVGFYIAYEDSREALDELIKKINHEVKIQIEK